MRARTLRDGSLVYPAQGPYPTVPENFSRDPKNPYRLIPEFAPCKFRLVVLKGVYPCGKPRYGFDCQRGLEVSFENCEQCSQREEP